MARLWNSGFELNSTAANVEWTQVGTGQTISTTHARSGTYAGRISGMTSATRAGFQYQFTTSASGPFWVRAYLYVVTLPSAENRIFTIDSATTTIASGPKSYITIDNTGVLRFYNSSATLIGTSSALSTGAYYCLEIKRDGSPASGSRIHEARLNGVAFATQTNSTDSTQIAFTVGGNLNAEAQTQGEWWFDDCAVNDSVIPSTRVQQIISASPASAATLVNTVLNAAPAGTTVILAGKLSGGATCSSVTDSRGNTWNVDVQETVTSGGRAFLASSRITTGLVAGDTITVTPSSSNSGSFDAYSYLGSMAFDKGATGNGTSTAGAAGPTSTLSQAAEVAVSVLASGSSLAASTAPTGWTLPDTAQNAGAVLFADLMVNATTALTATWTNPSVAWSCIVGTYKAAITPTQISYPGPGRIIHLRPAATGDSDSWTKGGSTPAATTWQSLNETPPDDAVTLVSASALNTSALYKMTASGIGSDDIVSVIQVFGRYSNDTADATASFKYQIEKAASGTKGQSAAIIPNSTTWRSANAAPRNSNLTLYLDPDGSLAWTQADLDTMQVGGIITAANLHSVRFTALWVSVDYVQQMTATATETSAGASTALLSGLMAAAPTETSTGTSTALLSGLMAATATVTTAATVTASVLHPVDAPATETTTATSAASVLHPVDAHATVTTTATASLLLSGLMNAAVTETTTATTGVADVEFADAAATATTSGVATALRTAFAAAAVTETSTAAAAMVGALLGNLTATVTATGTATASVAHPSVLADATATETSAGTATALRTPHGDVSAAEISTAVGTVLLTRPANLAALVTASASASMLLSGLMGGTGHTTSAAVAVILDNRVHPTNDGTVSPTNSGTIDPRALGVVTPQ